MTADAARPVLGAFEAYRRSVYQVAPGLVARMIAACIPSTTWYVNVTEASMNPAATRPSRYSCLERAPAMQSQ